MKKTFRKLHLWLSVPFGVIITLICFSGAMLVFEKELTEWTRPQLYRVQQTGTATLPAHEIVEKAAATLPANVTVTGITFSADPSRTWQVNLSQPRRAALFVDPYTGEIKGRNERPAFFTFMLRLHRWLLDSRPADGSPFLGRTVVGISTLMFVFVLLSGVVIWVPRTAGALKKRLSINLKKGWRCFWYDLHVAGGMYVMLALLALSLTGLTWSFAWYRTAVYRMLGAASTPESGHTAYHAAQQAQNQTKRSGQNIKEKTTTFAHWQQVYEQLKAQNPAYSTITVSDGEASVSFGRLGNRRASDRYTFDPHSGRLTDVRLYVDADRASKIKGWIYSIHVGSWGGLVTRLLSFVAALIGASLPLTGYYLWLKRLKGKTRKAGKACQSV